MHTTNDCLDRAMFIASESYSGSVYEMDLSLSMDGSCDEAFEFLQGYSEQTDVTAIAA